MRTSLLYGFITALAGAFVNLGLYFAGFHSDLGKLATGKLIGGLLAIAITITCTALGMKARREEVPAEGEFGYGQALGIGTGISFFAAVFGAIFTYCYYAFINPAMSEILLQQQEGKLEARGLTGDQLDKTIGFFRWMFTPAPIAVLGFIIAFIFGVLISLILAAILRRPPPRVVAAS